MNCTDEEFDYVIKIHKIDDYRLRPKRTAHVSSVPLASPNRDIIAHDATKPMFEGVCRRIFELVEKYNTGVKAKDIADRLSLSRKEVNHYLYGSLRKYVKVDDDYKWHVLKPVALSSGSISSPKTDKCNNRKTDTEQSPVNIDLLKTEAMLPYIAMFDKLVVSHREGLNAPHKYILLISIFTLIGKGIIRSNRFGSIKEIEDEFNETWRRLVPKGTPFNSMYTTPFWHLASERFWDIYTANNEKVYDIWKKPVVSIKKQRKELTAVIDSNLFNLMLNANLRRATISYLEIIIRNGLKKK